MLWHSALTLISLSQVLVQWGLMTNKMTKIARNVSVGMMTFLWGHFGLLELSKFSKLRRVYLCLFLFTVLGNVTRLIDAGVFSYSMLSFWIEGENKLGQIELKLTFKKKRPWTTKIIQNSALFEQIMNALWQRNACKIISPWKWRFHQIDSFSWTKILLY